MKMLKMYLIYFHTCNIIKNDYQQYSSVLYPFFPNKSFGQLLDTFPKNFMFLKTLIQIFHILKYDLLIKIQNNI